MTAHQIVPATAHAAGMPLDQFAERNAHILFDIAWLLDTSGNAIELGKPVLLAWPMPANHDAPRRMMSGACAMVSTLLTVVGQPAEAHIGGEWRLQARLALFAFEAFEQRRLLAADVSAGAVMDDDAV